VKRTSLPLQLASLKRTQLDVSYPREVASSVISEVDELDSVVKLA
jgi:hypothetical protein